MRFLLLATVAVAAWRLLGRRTGDARRVVVGWQDGSELDLRNRTPERDRLLRLAEDALP